MGPTSNVSAPPAQARAPWRPCGPYQPSRSRATSARGRGIQSEEGELRIVEYLQNAIATDPEIKAGAETLNAITKWILDLLKNAGAVGVLRYFAEKSHLTSLNVLSDIALFALFGWCISYTRVFIRPFYFLKNQKLAMFLDEWADRLAFIIIATFVVGFVEMAVKDFALMQAR